MDNIEVGDEVIVNGEINRQKFKNEKGFVVDINRSLPPSIGVRFDKPRSEFHDCSGYCNDKFGWYVNYENIKLIKPKEKVKMKKLDTIIPSKEKFEERYLNIKNNNIELKSEPGKKFDADKLRLDLLSFQAIEGTADILTFGSKKYGSRNWEEGISFSRVFAALLRHLFAWWIGEDIDKESGKNHLDHASCCLMFLQHYVKKYDKYKDKDDRLK